MSRSFSAWVGFTVRWRWPVLVLAAVVTVVAIDYTVRNLAIETSTTEMIDPSLPFRVDQRAFNEAFPELFKSLVIVVTGEVPDAAAEAVDALVPRLRRSERFLDVYQPGGGQFFDTHGFLYLSTEELSEVADRLADAQPLLATLAADPTLRGLADVFGEAANAITRGDVAELALAEPFARVADVVEAYNAGDRDRLSWQRLIGGDGALAGDTLQLVIVRPVLDYGLLNPGKAAMQAVEAAVADLELADRFDVRVRLTGDIALSVEELESISEGMGLAGTFSLALVAVLLVVGLRSARLIVATLVTLLAGLAWTAFFALAVIGEFNLISVAFAVLFIGLGVDFGIHFALRYREALAEHESFAALRSAAGRVGSPLALTAVAAAVGFFSFAPTHFRGLAELGIIAGSGMFIALFATLTLMPALIAAMPHSTGTPPPGRSTLGAAMRDAVDGNARAVVAAAALLGLAGLAAVPYARFDNNPLALKDPGSESVQTLDVLQERENFSLYGAQVVASDLEAAAETADRLKALPEVHRAITLRSFVPGEQEAKLDIIDTMSLFLLPVLQAEEGAPPSAAEKRAALADLRGALEGLSEDVAGAGLAAAAGRLASAVGTFLNRFGDSAAAVDALESDLMTYWPGRLERLVQALQAGEVELADIPRNLVDRYLSDDGRVRVEVIPAADLGAGEALSRFVEAVRGVAPDAVGQAIQILESGRVVARAIRDATAIALTAIAALLLALLRKPFDAALVMLPVALAGSLTVGSSVLLGIPFNFANVIVLPLLLGLGVAGGIHLVMRQRGEAENRMLGTITPRAVLFSALTTVGSFSSLALSSHQGTASMGKLLTIAIAWTLCATLIVLPAVATLRERRTARMTEAKEA